METFFCLKMEGNEELTESNRKKKKICVIKEIDLTLERFKLGIR